jgi:hypothetical protein
MIIDYKINKIVFDGKNTTVSISIYRGDFQLVQEQKATGEIETFNRYIRSNKVLTRDITSSGEYAPRQIMLFLNNKLKEIRDAVYLNLTFLDEQQLYV